MGKKFIFAVILALFYCPAAYPQQVWTGKDGNIRNVDGRGFAASEDGLYLATRNEVYRTKDSKGSWEAIFSVPSGDNEVTCLGVYNEYIFAGTKKGLFRSQDYGKSWRNVFKTILPEKNSIVSIEISKYGPRKILIGTVKGVFVSDNMGDNWKDLSGNLKNGNIRCVALNKDIIYAGGEEGLYYKKGLSDGWQRIYVSSPVDKPESEEAPEASESEEASRTINCIAFKSGRIYAGAYNKVLYSDDNGKSWNAIPGTGLAGKLSYILPSKISDKLYCGTTRGVFEFLKDEARWVELYKGFDGVLSIKSMAFEGKDEKSLWAVTEKGLYRLEGGRYITDSYIDVERNLKSLKIVFDSEPCLKELQQAAMKFAELDPDKIKKWRNQARLKALVPKITVGMDKGSSTNYEIYTSATKDYVASAPDDITNGVDVALSWELGDMIWSDDQNSIDVRSRLTTQLRNDILDDLRRLYYERKRLQFEIVTDPPKDMKARFEKELRIQELTSAIDDLTGNYLSEHMKVS